MSKHTRQQWQNRNDVTAGGPIASPPAPEPDPTEVVSEWVPLPPPQLAQDGATAVKREPPKPDPDGIAPGQIYDGAIVPDRKINRLGLRPGAKLPAIMIEVKRDDGTWMASFVGERASKIDVDAQMLKTGKLRK